MKCMIKTSIIIALVLIISVGFLTAMPHSAESAQEKAGSSKLVSIKSISVSGADDAAELIIKLSSTATYTSYKTTAPLRLVLDISQASQGVINAPIILNRGNFKTVTATRFDTDAGVLTRVDIEINKDAEAVIVASASKPGELRISFPSLSGVANPVEPVKSDSVVINTAIPSQNAALAPATVSSSVSNSRKLTSIRVQHNDISLLVEGGVSEFNTFRLTNPDRYVIDLLDTQISITDRIIPLNAAGVASARVGLYPNKIRVVLDSVDGTFPEASTVKTENGLIVSLNAKTTEKIESKVNPAQNTKPAEVVAPAIKQPPIKKQVEIIPPQQERNVQHVTSVKTKPASIALDETIKIADKNSASVEMVDFQVIEGISRVSIKTKGDVVIEPPVKSPGFVTVTIKNATLAKSLQRSLEAQSFSSPILRVTPLLVKSKKGSDTKVRISMRTAASYEFRQEGDMFYVDFKNPEGLTVDKISVALRDTVARSNKNSVVQPKDAELSNELSSPESSAKPLDTSHSYKGRKVTLEFADAEVRKIFQLLSEVSNKNFVLGDDVVGTISIKLVNVPWDQALDIILDTKGLDKREDGNIIIIKGKGKFKTQAEEEQDLKKALTKAIELKAEIFSINYSDISSIVTQLNNLKTERGTIAQDSRTNKIIVKDIPQVLDDMRKLIVQLDVPEKQVMIEARIVEATSTFTRSLGVNWGLHYRDGSASFFGINQLDTSFGGVASTPAPLTGLSGNSGGSMGISFGTLTSNIQLDLRLNAAASAGLVKIVSTPKVATLNNKTAKITQGQQVPYTSSTSDKVETKFVEAALSLEVTPHINANGTIGMKIDAKNDSVGQATGGSTAPAINKKQATTEMLLRDGETTVIGGIYVDSDNESDDGVPYLMDIPFLGKLFKSNSKTKVKTELLIFITPRILNTI